MKFTIPIKTVSEANQSEHWAKKAKRAKNQRSGAYMYSLQACNNKLPPKPWLIILTRCGKRYLDEDNNAGSLKHVQDGICDAIGIDDGDKSNKYVYRQRKEKEYFVEVEIKTLKDDFETCKTCGAVWGAVYDTCPKCGEINE